jgi:hypothetical protein
LPEKRSLVDGLALKIERYGAEEFSVHAVPGDASGWQLSML